MIISRSHPLLAGIAWPPCSPRLVALVLAFAAIDVGAQISSIQPGSALPDAFVGKFYAVTFTPVHPFGGLPVSWSITPGCLDGSGLAFSPLSLPAASARLQGVPTRQGSFDCVVTAIDAGDNVFQKNYHLDVVQGCTRPRITSEPPPAAEPGVPYNYRVMAFGIPHALLYAALGLPQGLTIDATTGVISGTTTAGGSHPVTIIVSGCGRPAVRSLTFVVGTGSVKLFLTSAPNPAFFGQAVAVQVHASGGASVPTGTVLLCVVGLGQYCAAPVGAPPPGTDPALVVALQAAPLDAEGNAAFILIDLSIQNYALQAYYGGDSGHAEARTGPVDQFVIKGPSFPPAKAATAKASVVPEAIPALSDHALALLALGIGVICALQLRGRRLDR
jgi:hypothetical protein